MLKRILSGFLNFLCLVLLVGGIRDVWRFSKRDKLKTVDLEDLSKVEDGSWVRVTKCMLSLDRIATQRISVVGSKVGKPVMALVPLVRSKDSLGDAIYAIYKTDDPEILKLIPPSDGKDEWTYHRKAMSDGLERIAQGSSGLDQVEGYLKITPTSGSKTNRELKKTFPELGESVLIIEMEKHHSMAMGLVFLSMFFIIVAIRTIIWRRTEGRNSALAEGHPKPPPLPSRSVPPPLPKI